MNVFNPFFLYRGYIYSFMGSQDQPRNRSNFSYKIGNQFLIIISNPNKFLRWQVCHDLHIKKKYGVIDTLDKNWQCSVWDVGSLDWKWFFRAPLYWFYSPSRNLHHWIYPCFIFISHIHWSFSSSHLWPTK